MLNQSTAEQLEAKVEKNFAVYAQECMQLSHEELFDKAREISVVQETYDDLLHTEWDDAEADALMAYENPLGLISDIRFDANREIRTDAAVEELMKHPQLGENYPLDENYAPLDQSNGIVMQ